MWKKLLETVKQLFALNETVNQHTKQIDTLKEEIHRIAEALRDVRDEVRRNANLEESEREMLVLKLENILLKAGIKPDAEKKKLPPKRKQKALPKGNRKQ